jgi:rod shape-determining protein MreC
VGETGYRTVGARVISRSMTFQTAVVTIDRGAAEGIGVGQAVVTEEGIYIGSVAAVGDRTATVRLLSDVRARVAASLAGGDRVAGVLEGRGNGTAHLTLIPQAVAIAQDGVVVTAGTEENIPPNLAIGLVNDIESRPTDPFQNAAIEPLAPLDRLELVSVILTGS